MSPYETTQALDLIRKLWAEWKPTEEQLDVFRDRMGRIDYGSAIQAIRAAFAGPAGRYTKPQLQTIMDGLPASQPRHAGLHGGGCGIYIQCVALDDKGRGQLGRFGTPWWPTDRGMPPEHAVLAAMEAFRADHERVYGGRWQIIREFNGVVAETEMCIRRAQLRGSQTLRVLDAKTNKWVRRPVGTQAPDEYRGTPIRQPMQEPVRQAVADFMAGLKPKHQGPPTPPRDEMDFTNG